MFANETAAVGIRILNIFHSP